jgi:hypothetical protein
VRRLLSNSGIEKYGDATFADPTNNKCPIDTHGRIKAAWASIHQPTNAAKYTAGELRTIKARVRGATTLSTRLAPWTTLSPAAAARGRPGAVHQLIGDEGCMVIIRRSSGRREYTKRSQEAEVVSRWRLPRGPHWSGDILACPVIAPAF